MSQKKHHKNLVKTVIGYVNYVLNFKRTRIKKLFQLTDFYVLRSLLASLDISSEDLSIQHYWPKRVLFRIGKNQQKSNLRKTIATLEKRIVMWHKKRDVLEAFDVFVLCESLREILKSIEGLEKTETEVVDESGGDEQIPLFPNKQPISSYRENYNSKFNMCKSRIRFFINWLTKGRVSDKLPTSISDISLIKSSLPIDKSRKLTTNRRIPSVFRKIDFGDLNQPQTELCALLFCAVLYRETRVPNLIQEQLIFACRHGILDAAEYLLRVGGCPSYVTDEPLLWPSIKLKTIETRLDKTSDDFSRFPEFGLILYDHELQRGAHIKQIMENSPADRCSNKLETNDVITSMNSRNVEELSAQELKDTYLKNDQNSSIVLTVVRDENMFEQIECGCYRNLLECKEVDNEFSVMFDEGIQDVHVRFNSVDYGDMATFYVSWIDEIEIKTDSKSHSNKKQTKNHKTADKTEAEKSFQKIQQTIKTLEIGDKLLSINKISLQDLKTSNCEELMKLVNLKLSVGDLNLKFERSNESISWCSLSLAAKFGQYSIVKLLTYSMADINQVDCNGTTALMYACETGHLEVVEILLENGADVSCNNNYGFSAILLAIVGKAGGIERQMIVEMLMQMGAGFSSLKSKTFQHSGTRHSKTQQFQQSFQGSIGKQSSDSSTNTNDNTNNHNRVLNSTKFSSKQPLHLAIELGYSKVVASLVDFSNDQINKKMGGLNTGAYTMFPANHFVRDRGFVTKSKWFVENIV